MKNVKHLLNRFFLNFINGIVVLLPVAITVLILRFLLFWVNDWVLTPILDFFPGDQSEMKNIFLVKVLLLALVVIGVASIGWATRILFIRRFFGWGEKVVIRVPIMGKIYKSVKQISTAFIGQGKTIFKQVVLVEYPRKGLHSIGFTTGDTRGEIASSVDSGINVFVPTTPNPTSGIFIVVPKTDVRVLEMSVEDGMKLIISGGSVTPTE